MDRFIDKVQKWYKHLSNSLKSNMDRFIAGCRGGIINEKIV